MASLVLNVAAPIVSVILGILVLTFPKFLRYFVGLWFLIFGILELMAMYL
ncbi:MAG: DUF3096 domain-containing protein [archaeon]